MREKIAVFSGGWSGEYLQNVLTGISRHLTMENYDVIAFVNFSIRGDHPVPNNQEINFFTLPDLSEFAGVILLANSFNNEEEFTYLQGQINKYNLPCITIEYKLDGIVNVSTDNFQGMYSLTEHLITKHHCKKLVYIGGPETHIENLERLDAFKKACKDYNIDITDKEIYFADWARAMVPGIIDNWLDNNEICPDVFVCANDIMAMSACVYLKSIGLSVPEDVLVTGYDFTRMARTFSPSIASVSHEWNNMGKRATQKILDIIKGQSDNTDSKLATVFIPGRSCSCDNKTILEAETAAKVSAVDINRIDPIDADSHFRHFYTSVKKAHTLQEVHDTYSYLFGIEHDVEGESFGIYLDPEFFHFNNNVQNLRTEGFSDEFTVVCQLRRGIAQDIKTISRKDMLKHIVDEDNHAMLYTVLPLYSELYAYGFAVLNGQLNIVNENQHYIWTRHMIQSLEYVSNNLLLEELNKQLIHTSVTDELSQIYNRTGCEKYIYPMLLEAGANKKKAVIMLIDVDHMKKINDEYGHINGDNAIKIVASIIRDQLPDNFEGSRFGGDEFLVGGIIDDSINMKQVVQTLEDKLGEAIDKEKIKFTLTISIGYCEFTANQRSDIEKAIMKADRQMYSVKKQHHVTYKDLGE